MVAPQGYGSGLQGIASSGHRDQCPDSLSKQIIDDLCTFDQHHKCLSRIASRCCSQTLSV